MELTKSGTAYCNTYVCCNPCCESSTHLTTRGKIDGFEVEQTGDEDLQHFVRRACPTEVHLLRSMSHTLDYLANCLTPSICLVLNFANMIMRSNNSGEAHTRKRERVPEPIAAIVTCYP